MTNMTVEQMTKIVYDAIDDKLGQDISIINIGQSIFAYVITL